MPNRKPDRLAKLEEQRAHDCRLTPDRALETLGEAEEFLRDRGLLTREAATKEGRPVGRFQPIGWLLWTASVKETKLPV